MDFLRKAATIIAIVALFSFLFVVSIFASVVVLCLGIIAMIWVRYKKPDVYVKRTTQTNVIDGEYRVIETTQVIEGKDG